MAVSLGTILKNQISVVDFLDQREIYSKVVDVTRERTAFNLSMLMQKMGKYVVSKMTNYHSFVNVELFQKETISAVPTDNGAGLNWTYVVASANGTSFGQVGDIVQIPDANRTQGIITTRVPDAGGDIITIQAVNGAMALTNGMVISVMSMAAEEGGGFVAAKNWKPVKKQNNIQIFAEDIASISDIQMETWIEVSTND